jgi:hypothetical protein
VCSEKSIKETKWHLFDEGLKYYMWVLTSVNIHINDNTLEKIGDSYLMEYRNFCKEDKKKESIDIIIEWLKEINEKYKKE